MFGKLKLNLEDIQVESFETTKDANAADGTVIGASGIFSGGPDCYASCVNGSCDSCDQLTACNPVNTCQETCVGCGSGATNDQCLTTNDVGCDMCV